MSRKATVDEQIGSVTDPRDYRKTVIPELQDIDTLLRCNICKGFLKTPVLTPCGHTFCSLCIREYLNREQKCPLCLAELRESMLKSEFLVNEIAASYTKLRPKLLEFLNVEKGHQTQPVEDSSCMEIEHHLASSDRSISRINEENGDGDDDDIQIIETRENRPSKRPADAIFASAKKSRKESPQSGITSLFNRAKSPALHQPKLADCPICGKSFPVEVLQRTHLDECLSKEALDKPEDISSSPVTVKPALNPVSKELPTIEQPDFVSTTHYNRYLESTSNGSVTRLAKINFSSTSLQQLKQKLSSLKLPTAGSRQQMINRYNHYEMLWNSNYIDSIDPVDESELRRRLASWESNHNASDIPSKSGFISKFLIKNPMKDFKTDRFDRKGWAQAHQRAFRRLIREAKTSLKKSKKATSEHAGSLEQEDSTHLNQSVSSDLSAVPSNQLVARKDNITTCSQGSSET
ncbi:LAME_0H15104g1_1 [Lachancea meyersii CBS 8951]|uniref:Postreplication repair E3 ubiquitin-protein ligase RAD18 n=1 Tax=Lachancea meyersii CBS 8951 TaxID=1266667 RepID=A0A1G4KHT4_9SACH|nr:LAME_0H15104g1_1 [Lachancea meyersii CBS 8951]